MAIRRESTLALSSAWVEEKQAILGGNREDIGRARDAARKLAETMVADVEVVSLDLAPVDRKGKILGRAYVPTRLQSTLDSRPYYLFVRGVPRSVVQQYLEGLGEGKATPMLLRAVTDAGGSFEFAYPDEAQPLYGLLATR